MPRPVREQVVVITGASSGIGRASAIEFGRYGAAVVLAARNEIALNAAAREVERAGGQAHVVVTDVSQWPQLQRLADQAVDRFGCIDTWFNNAAVSEYATVEQMAIEEIERIIQVDLLGTIYGVKAALPHLIAQGQGTIINMSSVLGKRAMSLQSVYSAAKHGVKGFTEALRMELEQDHPGINVTLILPTSINTPFFNHARSRMGVKPQAFPPVYEPESVAEAVVHAAGNPIREIVVGSPAKLFEIMEAISPSLIDLTFGKTGIANKLQQTDEPDTGRDILFSPAPTDYRIRGDFGHLAKSSSWYTHYVELHPMRKHVLAGAAAIGLVMLLNRAMQPAR